MNEMVNEIIQNHKKKKLRFSTSQPIDSNMHLFETRGKNFHYNIYGLLDVYCLLVRKYAPK